MAERILSPAGAVFGFAAWLTTRQKALTLGAAHDAAEVACLCDRFCKENNLGDPEENYTDALTLPYEE